MNDQIEALSLSETFWTVGAGHAEGAIALLKVARTQPPSHGIGTSEGMAFNGGLSVSIHLLMGYSFELLLKAVFVHLGGKAADLKRIGHSLIEALNRAESKGFVPKDSLRAVIEMLGPSHLGHQFRYGEKDEVFLPALDVSEAAMTALATQVGALIWNWKIPESR